jgi:hypothetical protein
MSTSNDDREIRLPLVAEVSVAELDNTGLLVLRINCVSGDGRGPMSDREIQVAISRKGAKAFGEALTQASGEPENGEENDPRPENGA